MNDFRFIATSGEISWIGFESKVPLRSYTIDLGVKDVIGIILLESESKSF